MLAYDEGTKAVDRALDKKLSASFVCRTKEGVTVIIDLDNGVSVASDIKAVVAWLRKVGKVKARDRFVYCDPFHRWDVVDIDGDKIVCNELDLECEASALALALAH